MIRAEDLQRALNLSERLSRLKSFRAAAQRAPSDEIEISVDDGGWPVTISVSAADVAALAVSHEIRTVEELKSLGVDVEE